MLSYTRTALQMPAARVFLRFPKHSQHPACMDHAILHRKPFSDSLIIALKSYNHPAFLMTSHDFGCYKRVTISAATFLASKSDA